MSLADRVLETSTTTGTGSYSLGGATTGYQTFVAGIGNGNTCFYAATDGTDWEVGIGTVASGSPDTLARTTVLASSNAGAAVNWGSGTKQLFVTTPAAVLSSLVANGASNGLLAQTAARTYARRSVAAGNGVAVTNGDGVSGNPTVAVDLATDPGLEISGAKLRAKVDGVGIERAAGGLQLKDDGVTLAKMAHGTQGGVVGYGASGAPTEIATGTAGQFLKSQGAGADAVMDDLPAAAEATAGVAEIATTAEVAAGSDSTRIVPADRMHRHPRMLKAIFQGTVSSGTLTSNLAEGCSVVRNSAGNFTVSWSADFASANYAMVVNPGVQTPGGASNVLRYELTSKGVSSVVVNTYNSSNVAADPLEFSIFAAGPLA